MLDRAGNRHAPIEIDGGIDLSNIARAVDAASRLSLPVCSSSTQSTRPLRQSPERCAAVSS